ncbi:hypothetical protein ABBQ32_008143 [Trebouxia sp. C0010 RCD-2024]
MFGLGTLTLPADFARLGWAVALPVIGLCALGMLYSGVLFGRLATHLPSTRAFDQLGSAAFGAHGKRMVYATVYLTILFEPVIFHLTCMESLQQMLYSASVSQIAAGSLVSLIIFPLGLVQGIEEVSAVAVLGTVGMLLAVITATYKLWSFQHIDLTPTELVHHGRFNTTLVAIMDLVFTYGGQVNWMRYITGMRHPSQFKYAAGVTSAFMTVLYVIMGSVGYYRLGSIFDFSRPVTSILPHDAWNVVMNAGVFVHCIFAYQINLNVWADMVLHVVAPSMNDSSARGTASGRLIWAAVIVVGIAFSFAVSVFFPFFSIVMALIASIGDLAAAYALPAMFNLKLLGHQMPSWEKLVCYIIIPVSLVLSGLGVYCSLASLIHEFWQRH